MKQNYNTFEAWMREVNDRVSSILFGMSADDLPDVCYADWYEEGVSPDRAARRAIRNANES